MNALLAVIAVLGVSASGPLMAATHAPAVAIAFWRNAAASAVLLPLATVTRRDELRRLSPRGRRSVLLAGVMLAAHFAAWVGALQLTTVAAATALVTTQLVWVLVIDRCRGVRVPRSAALGAALAVTGVLVISGVDLTISTEALVGDGLAVLGGLAAAVYLMAGEVARTELSTIAYTATCYGVCAVVLAAAALASGTALAGFGAREWALIAAVTVSAQFLGHSILNHLLAVMSPTVISLVLLFEVPGAALLAAVFLDQSPASGVYLGLALILAGLVVVTTRRSSPEIVLAD